MVYLYEMPGHYAISGMIVGLLLLRLLLNRVVGIRSVRKLKKKIRQTLWPHIFFWKKEGIWIGWRFLRDQSRLRHSHIVGATGSGKTVLMERLIQADIKRGLGMLIIDPKGEIELLLRIKAFAKASGREKDLKVLSTNPAVCSNVWNPCKLGTASELQTKFYNSAIYSEPHYAKHCERGLLKAFRVLKAEYGDRFGMKRLVGTLRSLAAEEREKNLEGLFLDLDNLLESDWRECFEPSEKDTGREVSLLEVTSRAQILYVDLPTESKAVQSSRIGRLLLQEIMLISGIRKEKPWLRGSLPFAVYIDEFDAFATQSFATFLNKARSSKFMIHIAHQTLSDLRRIDPHFTGQIMGNINNRFIFRQDDPDDADTWARFFGTYTTLKTTDRYSVFGKTGDGSIREVQEFLVSPNRIKNLPVGVCIWSVKTERILEDLEVPFQKVPVDYKGLRKRVSESLSTTSSKKGALPKPAINWSQNH